LAHKRLRGFLIGVSQAATLLSRAAGRDIGLAGRPERGCAPRLLGVVRCGIDGRAHLLTSISMRIVQSLGDAARRRLLTSVLLAVGPLGRAGAIPFVLVYSKSTRRAHVPFWRAHSIFRDQDWRCRLARRPEARQRSQRRFIGTSRAAGQLRQAESRRSDRGGRSNCDAVLGKVWHMTPAHWPTLRDDLAIARRCGACR
jgi:hypothetical protein